MTYGRSDLWTVTRDGKVTRLTDDGYNYSNTAFSPDGRFISYTRSFGTDMIIEQRLGHGGSRDLFILPVEGGESTPELGIVGHHVKSLVEPAGYRVPVRVDEGRDVASLESAPAAQFDNGERGTLVRTR